MRWNSLLKSKFDATIPVWHNWCFSVTRKLIYKKEDQHEKDGPVNTEDEKVAIESAAEKYATNRMVNNELQVKQQAQKVQDQ